METNSKKFVSPADLKMEVFFSHYEKHYIFFRDLRKGIIGIMSILHDSMHIPVRLREDLEKITGNPS